MTAAGYRQATVERLCSKERSTAIDLMQLLNTGLSVCTVVLLGAACITTLRVSARPRHRMSLPAAPAMVLFPLLAGLSVALVFRPGVEGSHIGKARSAAGW